MHHLAAQFRVGVTTVSEIIPEVCAAIWDYATNKLRLVVNCTGFLHRVELPKLHRSRRRKHITIQSPADSASLYFNYKGTFSVVLLAMVDAFYRFIYVDIGSLWKQSDAGIFGHSNLGKALQRPSSLNLPADCVIEEAEDLGPYHYHM